MTLLLNLPNPLIDLIDTRHRSNQVFNCQSIFQQSAFFPGKFIFAFLFLIVVTGFSSSVLADQQRVKDPKDPFERFNRVMFGFNEGVDKIVLKPIAKGYRFIAPKPVEKGVSNFFSNLGEVTTIANDLLQLKGKQAVKDTGRLAINSTIGIFGLFDVATKMGLDKNKEDFGQTLGRYNLPQGPYLVLPFLGPSTIKDAGGRVVDVFTNPLTYYPDEKVYNYSLRGMDIVDTRASLLDLEDLLTGDKYNAMKNLYLQSREFATKDGVVEDEFTDDGGDGEFMDEEFMDDEFLDDESF